ncbi:MAG: hypothetical protein O3A00_05100 [Planctomycetota bacterium]|nr:hypothetical protein [Planctomycetota bacterium]
MTLILFHHVPAAEWWCNQRGAIVGKIPLFFVSLVASIPGGYLSYVLVMVFLDRAEKMSTAFQVIAGVTLAFSALVTVIPFFILIFTPKKAPGFDPDAEGAVLAAVGAGAAVGAVAAGGADDFGDSFDDADDDDLDDFDDEDDEDDDFDFDS